MPRPPEFRQKRRNISGLAKQGVQVGSRGERPPDFERTREFGAALTLLAARDAQVHKLMVEVQQLLMSRSVLRYPDLVKRVRAVMAET